MQNIWENNGTEEIGLVTPTPDLWNPLQKCFELIFWILQKYMLL